MSIKRSSGILMHITSLPSPYGIGDLGPSAYDFVNFLKESDHRYWQILPVTPTQDTFSHSPYSSFSAFGGNPLLISPELLEKSGFIMSKDYSVPEISDPEKVDFPVVERFKRELLEIAFQNFKRKGIHKKEYLKFCKQERFWLEDHSLYVALQKNFQSEWMEWPERYRDRDAGALTEAKNEFSDAIEKEKFIQFLFYSQWQGLTKFAAKNGIGFFGDIPFYINLGSVDCWANQKYFKLDSNKQPTAVSGVPPDYFSETGQLWGTPVFNWKALQEDDFKWWVERIKHNLDLFDLVRLDHFRAFSAYWEIPAGHLTAIEGKWKKTPGVAFFNRLKKEIPTMRLVAEDLGDLDQPVYDLIDKFDFPGMRVLQFAFGDDIANTTHIPHRYSANNIVYSGTHDNNTTKGWYVKTGKTERKNLSLYNGRRVHSGNVHKVMHRLALASVGKVAIVPVQDILGLGEEAKMNFPGTTRGNWLWRISPEVSLHEKAAELRDLNRVYGRFDPEEV